MENSMITDSNLLYIYLAPGSILSMILSWFVSGCSSWLLKNELNSRAVTGSIIMKCKNIVFILHRLNFKHIQFQTQSEAVYLSNGRKLVEIVCLMWKSTSCITYHSFASIVIFHFGELTIHVYISSKRTRKYREK